MYKDPRVWDRINSFALVTYIPEPLSGFLDRLRQELVPNCFLRAHVTVLPPRPLLSTPAAARETIPELAPRSSPFDVEMTGVEVFPVSDVIYVNILSGSDQLKRLHEATNVEGLSFQDPFPFHPHVTLAQDLQPDEVDELARVARERWAEYSFPKTFYVEKEVFLQNTRCNQWIHLDVCRLRHDESKLLAELTDLLVG